MGGRAGFLIVLLALTGCNTRRAVTLDEGAGNEGAGNLDAGTLDVPQAIDQVAVPDQATTADCGVLPVGPMSTTKCTAARTGPWCQGHLFNTMLFPVTDPKVAGITTGDFNSDGFLDLAVATSDGVKVVLQQAGAQASSYNAGLDVGSLGDGSCSNWLVLADDFNADGKLDLALSGGARTCHCGKGFTCESQLSVLLGNGNGTFQSPLVHAKQARPASGMVTADFNSDGTLDLAIVGEHKGRLMLGNGNGTFGEPFWFDVGMEVGGLSTADFNADGIPDLVVGENPIRILLGKGKQDNGTFFNNHVYCPVAGDLGQMPAVGDFNGDGILDIAVARSLFLPGLFIVMGNGKNGKWDGTCTTLEICINGNMEGFVTGDFDCDGILDLAFSGVGPRKGIHVRRGKGSNGVGNGTFGPDEVVFTEGAYAIAAGDFDNNGGTDIAMVGTAASPPLVKQAGVVCY